MDSMLRTFLPNDQYFRFNPSIEPFDIDEIRSVRDATNGRFSILRWAGWLVDGISAEERWKSLHRGCCWKKTIFFKGVSDRVILGVSNVSFASLVFATCVLVFWWSLSQRK